MGERAEKPLVQDRLKPEPVPAEIRLNETLASNFPEWDLLPPENMVKRNGSRFA